MRSRKKADAVATIGTYKDQHTGEDKRRYLNVGTLFENEDGRLSLKLDCLPLGKDWSGYINFFEPRDRSEARTARSSAPSTTTTTTTTTPDDNDDDDIPF